MTTMTTPTPRLALVLATTLLGACGAAHRPALGQADTAVQFVAGPDGPVQPATLEEILVTARRLPALGAPAATREFVVSLRTTAGTQTALC